MNTYSKQEIKVILSKFAKVCVYAGYQIGYVNISKASAREILSTVDKNSLDIQPGEERSILFISEK